jgi:hypothetical protein
MTEAVNEAADPGPVPAAQAAALEPHVAALQEFYQGEILGEAMFDAMLPDLEDGQQRYKVGLLLQLESETKVRLRPAVAAAGLPLQEDPRMRPDGEKFARDLRSASWAGKMQALHDAVAGHYVPHYRKLAALMPPELREVGDSMVEHEEALAEMAWRELNGQGHRSDEPLLRLLSFGLSPPAAG